MPSSPPRPPDPPSEDEDQYEYEYSTQTETHHILLDLSSHLPPHARHQNHPPKPSEPSSPSSAAAPDKVADIQILDLHGPNPTVSYLGRVYACEWGSAVGTDVVLCPGDGQGREAEVVACTNLRLTGVPVRATRRGGEEGEGDRKGFQARLGEVMGRVHGAG